MYFAFLFRWQPPTPLSIGLGSQFEAEEKSQLLELVTGATNNSRRFASLWHCHWQWHHFLLTSVQICICICSSCPTVFAPIYNCICICSFNPSVTYCLQITAKLLLALFPASVRIHLPALADVLCLALKSDHFSDPCSLIMTSWPRHYCRMCLTLHPTKDDAAIGGSHKQRPQGKEKTSKSAERIWLTLISYITPRTRCVSICKFVLMCWLQAGRVKLGANRPNFLPISAPAVPAPSPNSGTKPFYRPSNRPLLYIYNVHARRASHFTTNYESWHISYMYSVTKSSNSIWLYIGYSLHDGVDPWQYQHHLTRSRKIFSTSKVERPCHATRLTSHHVSTNYY